MTTETSEERKFAQNAFGKYVCSPSEIICPLLFILIFVISQPCREPEVSCLEYSSRVESVCSTYVRSKRRGDRGVGAVVDKEAELSIL
jgi:hypothetical protein